MYHIKLRHKGLPPVEVGSRMYFADALDFAYFHREFVNCDMLIYYNSKLIASIIYD